MAAILDKTIDQGATLDETVYPPLHLQNEDQTPFDLTEWSVRGKVRTSYKAATALADFAFTVSSAEGIVQPLLTAAQTALFPGGKDVVYDVEIYKTVDNVEVVKRIVQGTFTISPEATK